MEVHYGATYVCADLYWNYRNRSKQIMTARNLTAIASQHILIFIVAVKLRHMVQWYTPSLRDRFCFASNATPSLFAMNPEEVQLPFAAQMDLFDPILGQLTNYELTRLREELTTILLLLLYDVDRGIHNIIGLVLDKDN